MHIQIQPADELPIYKQIVRQVREGLASGRLTAGEKLPSQRELAVRLCIAPLTVKKAYDRLELDSVIETRRGQGTFITQTPPLVSPEDRRQRMQTAVQRLVTDAWASGMSLSDLVRLVRSEHKDADTKRKNETPGKSTS